MPDRSFTVASSHHFSVFRLQSVTFELVVIEISSKIYRLYKMALRNTHTLTLRTFALNDPMHISIYFIARRPIEYGQLIYSL